MESGVVRLEQCLHCEAGVDVDARFCPHCGKRVVRAAAPADDATLRATASELARGTLGEVRTLTIEALKSKTGKRLAAGAALGAAAGVALPLLTVGAGAVLGAGYVAFKRLTR
ncbi:anti-sigma factor ChrR (cupin superfamily) [Sphingomonas naasensis]|uniref:Zinc ribbon domain-containing protein n=1 Tax=Sphingomonas naasensis TaxID=1344951 RepID=A0A4S1WKI3_9SPHN|nr:zinc ribbon domain-containing protein [Sphingomonas naasensis]NIJ21947.1 anti-sigma factor ChrR (cupin superfamily) [Sphingomonas naasensis]TGX42367.1 zinc ribbon domain-containing protein [Sphingomonas naasensis]